MGARCIMHGRVVKGFYGNCPTLAGRIAATIASSRLHSLGNDGYVPFLCHPWHYSPEYNKLASLDMKTNKGKGNLHLTCILLEITFGHSDVITGDAMAPVTPCTISMWNISRTAARIDLGPPPIDSASKNLSDMKF